MTIKVDRKPTSESLLVCLDKKTGVKESGLIDPKNMGKTEALGTVVAIGENTKGFKVGDRIYLPVNQQKDPFVYEGNTFCTVHYSYITLFVVDEYEVDLEKIELNRYAQITIDKQGAILDYSTQPPSEETIKKMKEIELAYGLATTSCGRDSNVTHDGRKYIKNHDNTK